MENGFLGKLFCGKCGIKLRRFSGERYARGVRWGDETSESNCVLRRLWDDELRRATSSILDRSDVEPAFVELVSRVLVFDDILRFQLKDGTVKIWQRE